MTSFSNFSSFIFYFSKIKKSNFNSFENIMENGAFAPSGANAPFSIMFSMLTFLRCVKVCENAPYRLMG